MTSLKRRRRFDETSVSSISWNQAHRGHQTVGSRLLLASRPRSGERGYSRKKAGNRGYARIKKTKRQNDGGQNNGFSVGVGTFASSPINHRSAPIVLPLFFLFY